MDCYSRNNFNSWWFLVSHQGIYHSLMQLLKMHYSRIILKEFNKPCEKRKKKDLQRQWKFMPKVIKKRCKIPWEKKGSMFALSPSSWCRIFWDTFAVSDLSIKFTNLGYDTEDGSTEALLQILYGQYLILGVFGSCMF